MIQVAYKFKIWTWIAEPLGYSLLRSLAQSDPSRKQNHIGLLSPPWSGPPNLLLSQWVESIFSLLAVSYGIRAHLSDTRLIITTVGSIKFIEKSGNAAWYQNLTFPKIIISVQEWADIPFDLLAQCPGWRVTPPPLLTTYSCFLLVKRGYWKSPIWSAQLSSYPKR